MQTDAAPAGTPERERAIAGDGVGPLLQRDYWAVIANCSICPDQFGDLLARRFAEFAPDELACFRRSSDDPQPLCAGEELTVEIRLAGSFGIRVLHSDANSLTLSTLAGHPESGRITFGAYRSDRGDVVFHIRSRARSSSRMHFAEYLTAGEGMQTATWASFINAVARAVGDGVLGDIRATTEACEDLPDDDGEGPTFIARGS